MIELPSDWRVRVAALCVAAALFIPTSPDAQETGLRVQQFEPDSNGLGYFTAESARTGTLGRVIFGLHFNYASGVLGTWNGDELQSWAVERQLGVDLGVGMGFDVVDVVVRIPFAPYQTGTGVAGAEFGVAAFGDIVVTPKVRIMNPDARPVGLAVALPVSFPSGNAGALYGDVGMTVTPTAVAEVRTGPLDAAVNLGVVARKKSTIQGLDVGSQFLYRLAVRVRPVPVFGLQAELWGVAGGNNVAASPANWLGGLYVNTDKGLVVRAGVGTGIGAGYGAPKLRVVFGIGGCRPAPSEKDADGDGINTRRDDCPEQAEDLDGFEDADGCPDPDNDGDGVLDEFDECPREWEDDNGIEDGDGCPDGEPVAEEPPPAEESAPVYAPRAETEEPETLPDLDDADAGGDWMTGEVYDDYDAGGDWLTSDLEEDIDWGGLEEADADVDWDDSGDDLGALPAEEPPPPPTVQWDGGGLVAYDDATGDLQLLQQVVFQEGTANLSPDSFAVLNRVADLLLARPDIGRVEIQGHTAEHDSATSNRVLAQHRGETVAKYMLNRGVEPSRLIVVGYGDARPADDPAQASQRIEFHVLH